MARLLFRMLRVDKTELRGTMQGEQLLLEIGEFRTEEEMLIMVKQSLLSVITENGEVLDEEDLLFIAGRQVNTFDDDVDKAPIKDLARNEDNIFQADQCDAFDYGVDEAPTA
ncbi:hypothetical protein Tco_0921122 [Tanacetum coccineum]